MANAHEKCRDPGSNRGPSDLQSDALPTELSRLGDRHQEDNKVAAEIDHSESPGQAEVNAELAERGWVTCSDGSQQQRRCRVRAGTPARPPPL